MRGGAAAGRIDLLTVLAHELEHLIGFGHNSEPGHLMSETLAPGKRLLPIGRVTRSTTSSPTQIGRVWQRFLATWPSRSREAEQQRKPFEEWGSFVIALPRGSEAATFV